MLPICYLICFFLFWSVNDSLALMAGLAMCAVFDDVNKDYFFYMLNIIHIQIMRQFLGRR